MKTNLIILITPHIVRSDTEVEKVKRHVKEGYLEIIDESIGDDSPGWEKYFDSQMKDKDGVPQIDMTDGDPKYVETPDWDWKPDEPETDAETKIETKGPQ